MLIRKTHRSTLVEISFSDTTVERLSRTCFRGREHRLAGNLFRWNTALGLFNSRFVVREFLADVWESRNREAQSVEIEFPVMIGWASTDILSKYPADALEHFKPNYVSTAVRIKPDRTDILAPQTNLLTIIYELKAIDDGLWVIIKSIYPGHDIGVLNGDVTERENCVFFDWNHPGA